MVSEREPFSPLRIAYLIFSSGLGGGELLLLNHLAYHDRTRIIPFVVCGAEGELPRRLRALGIAVEILPINREREYFRRFSLPKLATLFRLLRWLRRNRIDQIHSYTLETRNYAHAAAILSGLPLLHTSQDTWFGGMFGRAQWWAINHIPQRIIVTSASVSKSLHVGSRLRADNVVSISPGLDLQHFRPRSVDPALKTKLGLPASAPIVGAIGRLSSVKGWDVFVRAMTRVASSRADVYFLLVGAAVLADDDGVDQLTQAIKAAGLGERIVLTGFRDDIPELISVMNVLVSTSPRESFGLVLAEAAACERPVVSVRNGGAQEIVLPERTGVLVDVDDDAAVAAAVLQLLADPQRCREMGAAARAHIEARFDIRAMVRRIEDEYRKIAESRHGRRAA